MKQDDKIERLGELIRRFESTIRMYKFVVNNPKYFDRNFHMREIEHLHKFVEEAKRDFLNEDSDN